MIDKTRKTDRVLLLKAREGGSRSSTGLVDKRLFTGGNNLHVIQNDQGIWSYKYEEGAVPPVLKGQSFTSFNIAYDHAKRYFNSRNIDIVGVDD